MEKLEQKTIEFFFDKFKVSDPDVKAKLLAEVTDVIYDYNNLIVSHEKETDEYKKNQIKNDIVEQEEKINEIFASNLGEKK